MDTFVSQNTTLHVKPDAPAAKVLKVAPDGGVHLELHATDYAGDAHSRLVLYGFPEDLARLLDGALAVVLADREQVSA